MAGAEPSFKYWAFLSYSHRDKAWAEWLHRGLETFVVPSRLIGRPSRDGKVPGRLFPVFRDQEELPTSSDLGSDIDAALRASRYLVVICSPAAAASRWVEQEVRAFKALDRSGRVLCLIVDGEPNASSRTEDAARECFPRALRFRVAPDGSLTDEPAEPIAADARPGQDVKDICLLRVAAGLLGVGFDELRQRDQERRRRRNALAAAAALALGGLLFWQEHAKVRGLRSQLARVYFERAKVLRDGGDPAGAALLFAESHLLEPSAAARLNAQYLLDRSPSPRLALRHSQAVTSVALGDGLLAAGALDGSVRLWDPETGEARGPPIRVLGAPVRALAVDFHARRLLMGGEDGAVAVWDIARATVVAGIALGAPARAVAFSPDGAWATADDGGDIRVWSADGQPGAGPFRHAGGVAALSFSPDARLPRSLGADGDRRSWPGGGLLPGPRLGRRTLAWSEGSSLLVLDGLGAARVWDPGTGMIDSRPMAAPGTILSGAVSGEHIALGSSDRTVRVWEWTEPESLIVPIEPAALPLGGSFDADGTRLVTYSAGATEVWDTASAARLKILGGSSGAAVGRDGAVVRFDRAGAEVVLSDGGVRRLASDRRLEGVALSHCNETDATAATIEEWRGERFVRLWPLRSAAEPRELANLGRAPLLAFALSDCGSIAVDFLGREGSQLQLRSAYSGGGGHVFPEQEGPAGALAFGGSRLLAGGEDGVARVWELDGRLPVGRPMSHGEPVRRAAFSRDGALAATAGERPPVRLWDAGGGEPVGEPFGDKSESLLAIAFDAGGSRLLTLTGRGTLRAWDLSWAAESESPYALVRAARRAAGRRLDARGEFVPWSADDPKGGP